MWNDGLLVGYINKYNTETALKTAANSNFFGTLILRFSDSLVGGLSVSVIENVRVRFFKPNIIFDGFFSRNW